jgi:signal recognition particle GTPase
MADVGVTVAAKMTASLRETARKERMTDAGLLRPALITAAQGILKSATTEIPTENPRVVLVVGVNGAGKTPPSASFRHVMPPKASRLSSRQPIPSGLQPSNSWASGQSVPAPR